jgi:PAS domain S-box-containing protein
LLLVPDAAADSRFASEPLIEGEEPLCFYAGVPLFSPQGRELGILCVLDGAPRQLDATQQEAMRRLGRQAEALIVAGAEREQEKERAAAALAQARSQARSFWQSTLDALAAQAAVLGPDGKIVAVNRSWSRFGRENQGTFVSGKIGENFPEVCATASSVDAEDAVAVAAGVAEVLAARRPEFEWEYRCRCAREECWLKLRVACFEGEEQEGGCARHVMVTQVNISLRKAVEAKLNREKLLLQSQTEASLDGILVVSDEGEILSHNQRFVEMWGLPPHVISQCSDRAALQSVLDQVVSPQEFLDKVEHLYQNKQEWSQEEIPLRDGRVFDRYSTPFVIPHLCGRVWYFRDITARKKWEQALRESEGKFRTIFETSLDAILLVDNNGKYLGANSASCALLGLSLEEVLNHDVTDFVSPATKGEVGGLWEEFLREGRQEGEFEFLHSDGSIRYAEYRAVANLLPNTHMAVLRDITQRKKADALLKESEEHLRFVLNASNDGVWEWDLTSGREVWSEQIYRVLGLSPGSFDVDGPAHLALMHPEDIAASQEALREHLENDRPYSLKVRYRHHDGHYVTVLSRGQAQRDAQGRPVRLIGSLSDLSSMAEVEEALRKSEQEQRGLALRLEAERSRLAEAQAVAKIGSWELDLATDALVWSDENYRIFGLDPAQTSISREDFLQRVHPDERAAVRGAYEQSLASHGPYQIEHRVCMDDGSIKVLHQQCRTFYDEQGRPVRSVGTSQDITERKKAEEEVRYILDGTRCLLWQAIVEDVPGGPYKWEFSLSNPEAAQKFLPVDVPPGGTYSDGFFAARSESDLAQMYGTAIDALTSNASEYSQEYRLRLSGGEEVWLSEAVHIEPLQTGRWSLLGVCTDITQVKRAGEAIEAARRDLEVRVEERTLALSRANHQLQAAKEEAERANAAKSEFLSRMSHELRTPLNAILGFGQILESQELSPLQEESVAHILKGGHHLLDLINEVLDITRVESGYIDLAIEPVSLGEIMAESCAFVRALAMQSRIHLDQRAQEEHLPLLESGYVLADRQRLKQVLLNLLANAIKYNHAGGQVEVFCNQKPNGRVRLCVRDSGPGIAPGDLPKLFAPFERLSAANSGVEGTGLGLVLSQRLVSAMGGRLTVESRLGEGSTFSIELPQAPAPKPLPSSSAAHQQALDAVPPGEARSRVLCIEDNEPNLRLIQVILEDQPHIELLTATLGRAGLELAFSHQPDLILLDVNLPDISGVEVLSELKQSARTALIPVIIISADATSPQTERLLRAGAVDYLSKPLNVPGFLQALESVLRNPPTST